MLLMAETLSIRPANLLIDENNPRLLQPNVGQRDAFRALAGHEPKKLLALAKDIVESGGLDPTNLPIVMRLKGDTERFIVLEGNRRLASLKALESPETLIDAVDKDVLTVLRDLSKTYQESPIEKIPCLLVKDRDEARHWIELRHTGENKGAGVVPWGSDESARFRARGGYQEIHSQALDWLEKHGHLTIEQRRKIPAASFKRLLGTPEVRDKLGIGLMGGEMKVLGEDAKVAKALLHVIDDLTTADSRSVPRVKTKDIYERDQRVKYAESLPKQVVVPKLSAATKAAKDKVAVRAAPKKPEKFVRPKRREVLIPATCILTIPPCRCKEIEGELRVLNLEEYPNAIAVLFRVFVELSVDSHIAAKGLATSPDAKLRVKMQDVVADLITRTKLTAKTAAPVRKAMQKDTFLAPSIDLWHAYVHNENVFPAPSDLRAGWDSLEPFFKAIWSP